jgi:hypothetical protein
VGERLKIFLSDSVKKLLLLKRHILGMLKWGFFFEIFSLEFDPMELKWIGEKRGKRSPMFTRLHGEIF